MPRIEIRRRVPRPAERIFDLVADIEAYPEFLPGCARAIIHERKETSVEAELIFLSGRLAWLGLGGENCFTSSVILDRENLRIETRQRRGLFRDLFCKWRFIPIDAESCDVIVKLDFHFEDRFLDLTARPLMGVAVRKAVSAFEARAMEKGARRSA